jgi:hypothetical protein
MNIVKIILISLSLSGCAHCAYGYSSACGDTTVNDDKDQNQDQNKDSKDKKEDHPSTGWN